MKHPAMKHGNTFAKTLLFGGASLLFLVVGVADAYARPAMAKQPPLTITNDPLPADLQSKIYGKPLRAPVIDAAQVMGSYYTEGQQTAVGRKVDSLRSELFSLQGKVADLSETLAKIETKNQQQAATYYASVATIATQLQSGTTPGNPRLLQHLSTARSNLESLAGNVSTLNDLAVDISGNASTANYLLESTRATYGLAGAVEEDHVRLAQIEDAVNNTVVVVDRLLNNVNDDISRTSAYLGTERDNLRTLALAISTGDLFGKSLANTSFMSARPASFSPDAPGQSSGMPMASAAPMETLSPAPAASPAPVMESGGSPRPLVKIRFDRANVEYEQPVYMAVNNALSRYPHARFEVMAVHPAAGNAAQIAIESTRSRRNAEKVLRSLTQMGLPLERVDISYSPSKSAATNEVHIYVR